MASGFPSGVGGLLVHFFTDTFLAFLYHGICEVLLSSLALSFIFWKSDVWEVGGRRWCVGHGFTELFSILVLLTFICNHWTFSLHSMSLVINGQFPSTVESPLVEGNLSLSRTEATCFFFPSFELTTLIPINSDRVWIAQMLTSTI